MAKKEKAKLKPLSKPWFKRHWSNILMVIFIALLIIPQTRMSIMVFVQRTFAFSPSTTKSDEHLEDYEWELERLDGKEYSFTKAKDEVAVVNFWATWCAPCVAEMPSFQKLYEEYGDKVNFYFVTDEDADRVDPFMEKHDLDLPIYKMNYAPPEIMQSKALPTTFIFDKQGGIHVKKKGSANWNSKKIRGLLDKLVSE